MFAARQGGYIIGYEGLSVPTWRARRCAIRISYLKSEGYSPWRHRNMAAPKPTGADIIYNIDSGRTQESTMLAKQDAKTTKKLHQSHGTRMGGQPKNPH
jgi:hypothetical protein